MTSKDSMYLPLVESQESEETMESLFWFASFGETTQKALKEMFCNGGNLEQVCFMYDLDKSNFKKSLKRLNEIDRRIHLHKRGEFTN